MPGRTWGNALQAAMPTPPTFDPFMQFILQYGRSSGEANFATEEELFSGRRGKQNGTNEPRNSAVGAAVKFDALCKEKNITCILLDGCLELLAKYRLSVETLSAEPGKQEELLERRKQLGGDPK